MIGQGQAHIRTVVASAQSQHKDETAPPCVEAFASLGNFGSSSKNEERDLHRWLRNLFDLQLEVYWTSLRLQVPSLPCKNFLIVFTPAVFSGDLLFPTFFIPQTLLQQVASIKQ